MIIFFLFLPLVYFIKSYGDIFGFFKKQNEQFYEGFIDTKAITEKEISRNGALVGE